MDNQKDIRLQPRIESDELIHFEVKIEEKEINGRITDISLAGAGIEIEEISEYTALMLSEKNVFFLKFIIDCSIILVSVQNIWHVLVPGKNDTFKYRGGVKFTMISPEDNLKLSELVDSQRKC